MYNKILIATDGSELAGRAVDHGLLLAKAVGADVIFVTVTELWSALEIAREFERGDRNAINTYEAAAEAAARKILDEASERADAEGVKSVIRHVRDRKPAAGIMEVAESEGCDLIVMASHGRRGIEKMLIGSQTSEVLTFSKCPVLVLR